MQRMGTCNRCGQCCGADGSPEQRNPWPSAWYSSASRCSFRRWQLADVLESKPILLLFNVLQKEDGSIGAPDPLYNSVRITGPGGGRYYYVWTPGHAICRDISAGHDGSSYSLECPFLLPDSGDSTRPCALVGTNQDDIFRVACEPEPLMEKTAEQVTQWQQRHPLCSYTWE